MARPWPCPAPSPTWPSRPTSWRPAPGGWRWWRWRPTRSCGTAWSPTWSGSVPWVDPTRRCPRPIPVTLLDPAELGLLVALGNGASVRAAARQLNLSVRTAYRRIEAARATLGDVPLGTAVGRVLAAQAAYRSASPSWNRAPALVGRDAELAAIAGAVRDGRSVRVCGPAGSGVSSLIRAVSAAAERPVAAVAGLDLCRDRPLLAVAALLGRSPASRDVATAAREVAAALAGQVVVVDDAQWLDRAECGRARPRRGRRPRGDGQVVGRSPDGGGAGRRDEHPPGGRRPPRRSCSGRWARPTPPTLARTVDGLPADGRGRRGPRVGRVARPVLFAAAPAQAWPTGSTRAPPPRSVTSRPQPGARSPGPSPPEGGCRCGR